MKLSLERYAQIGFGVAALTIVLTSFIQYGAMRALGVSGQWVGHTSEVILEVAATRLMAKAGESAARAFVLSENPALLAAMKESIASANEHERKLRLMTADNPRQQQRLDELEPLLARRFQVLEQLTTIRRQSGVNAAVQFAKGARGLPLAIAVESLGLQLQNEEYELLEGRRLALEQDSTRARILSTVASLFSLLLLGAAATVIRFDTRRRKKMEADLRYEKDLFTTLMDTVPSFVYFKDGEGRFLRVNAAMGRRLGLANVAEAIGKSDADFYASEYAEKIRADEKAVMQTGFAVVEKEEQEVQSNGREAWLISSRLPMTDSRGIITGTFGLSRDITAAKLSDEALETANSKLTAWNGQLEMRNREIMLLGEMGELLQTCINEGEAENILGQFARELCPSLPGALSIIKASRNLVERTTTWGDAAAFAAAFAPEDCWALRRGHSHRSGGPNDQIRCAHIDSAFTGSFVCVPMMAHGETLGVVHLVRMDGTDLDKSELWVAKMLAERMALAVANLRLREALKAQSIRDPLTGLFNRRYMEESLERELHRADREGSTIGIIMLDLDHFKRFNDIFGHDGGDEILKKVSQLLTTQTRREDIVCRYGGEEFLIILPGASLEDTKNHAERLLVATRNVSVTSRGRELGPVSASMGVGLYPAHGSSIAPLIMAADAALYEAKKQGRDRVVLASFDARALQRS